MRLLTIRSGIGTRAARIEGDEAVELPYEDIGALLASGDDWGKAGGTHHPLDRLEVAPVVVNPSKVICLGLNYRAHIEEMGHELPAHPTLFAKFARALTGARDPIPLPAGATEVDWEAELAFVIGRHVRHAAPDEAAAAIAGFTVLNDVSMRDWQWRTSEWLQGKTFERCTPVGPVLVTPDEVGGVAPDLLLTCEIDGERMQEARTSDLLFGPAAIVSYVSSIVTLDPGDLISTGTPGGVGAGRQPPAFLRPGQVVRTAIGGIGELVNECVPERPST